MTGQALRTIPCHRLGAPTRLVRIVTRSAGKPPLAVPEARRLPEPISLTHYLELAAITGVRGVIEMQQIRAQRLAGPERIRLAIETADRGRQLRAGGLEVTLHTDIHLKLRTQARRVQNCGFNFRLQRLAARGQLDVPRPGTMAALA